ncbi:hybrid sensor histidine kinase/response regulator [Roseateles oligotrophus]|uniref:histidine kinase n=1 Tax=Roseateles oligotrophus TaxID=1769250 RepID=A0ABT2YEU0_9BURK|nr:hybrid sensor histidine kinase/response regulator [Roseateles oligotrophus]MCV2368565.1 hybrid sensor histidine kinase/response regulator [Roseateles oligotrophus]
MQEPDARLLVLIVDDTPVNVNALAELLRADYRIKVATSGQTAIAIANNPETRPDLILLDVMMPGMDGHQVCRRLKDDAQTCGIPIIFVTGQNDPLDEVLGLKLGAVDFITKPINAAVVQARVHTHLLLHQLKLNLEAKVRERTAEFELALSCLEESRRQLTRSEAKATLSTLVASVTHELRSPLGNAVMTASTLANQAQKLDVEAQSGTLKRNDLSEFVNSMQEGCGLLLRNLERAEQLLSQFQHVAADQASEQRREFDLAETVREVLATLAPSLSRHAHRVLVEIPAGIRMESQPGPLGQIVINLVNNAYLHAFDGREQGLLTISGELVGDSVRLSFVDNGVGIPEENFALLFKPFFSTKIGKGGTGLGMTIVLNLVKKTLGGELQVSSKLGQGTRVDIRLPRVMTDSQNAAT